MKKLSIEEKAKAYDEALERAKKYYDVDEDNTMQVRARGVMEYLFPELKESEDERIRRAICLLVNGLTSEHFKRCGASFDQIHAWLEKQDTQTIKEALRTEYEKGRADAIAEIHNCAWSDEDEKNLKEALSYIKDETLKTFIKKRIQPHNMWKPSDEQMKVLEKTYEFYNECDQERGTLMSLYSSLQKLL